MREVATSGNGRHWRDNTTLGHRAIFSFAKTGMRSETNAPIIASTLKIQPLKPEDGGVYRCRVDFKEAPTKNTKIDLQLIIPSDPPQIFTGDGQLLLDTTRPVEERHGLTLVCETNGGDPLPRLSWWRGKSLVDNMMEYVDKKGRKVKNTLVLNNLQRSNQGEKITCKAVNTNLTSPLKATVAINMVYPPVRVKLVREWNSFVAGEVYNVSCQVLGSRPPASTAIFIGSSQLRQIKYKVSADGNIATTTVIFIPEPVDQDKILYCRAKNLHITADTKEDQWKIKVTCPPRVSVSMTSMTKDTGDQSTSETSGVAKMGDTVYIQCTVSANPPVQKIYWKFKDKLIREGNGEYVQEDNVLIIANVNRLQSGHYSCGGKNQLGSAESPVLDLKVLETPFCGNSKRITVINMGGKTSIELQCSAKFVGSTPDVVRSSLGFDWMVNSTVTKASRGLNPDLFTVNGSESHLTYSHGTTAQSAGSGGGGATAASSAGGETVICLPYSSVGVSSKPCIFHIVSSGPTTFSQCPDGKNSSLCNAKGGQSSPNEEGVQNDDGLNQQELLLQSGKEQLAATTTEMESRNPARFFPIMIVLISVVLLLIIISMIIILVLRSQLCRSNLSLSAAAAAAAAAGDGSGGGSNTQSPGGGTLESRMSSKIDEQELLNLAAPPTTDSATASGSNSQSMYRQQRQLPDFNDPMWNQKPHGKKHYSSSTTDRRSSSHKRSGAATAAATSSGGSLCNDGSHQISYATIACVRRSHDYNGGGGGRHAGRGHPTSSSSSSTFCPAPPPKRQASNETILPPPPSFYNTMDHTSSSNRGGSFYKNMESSRSAHSGMALRGGGSAENFLPMTSLASVSTAASPSAMTSQQPGKSNVRTSRSGTLRRVAFKDVPPPSDSSNEDLCTTCTGAGGGGAEGGGANSGHTHSNGCTAATLPNPTTLQHTCSMKSQPRSTCPGMECLDGGETSSSSNLKTFCVQGQSGGGHSRSSGSLGRSQQQHRRSGSDRKHDSSGSSSTNIQQQQQQLPPIQPPAQFSSDPQQQQLQQQLQQLSQQLSPSTAAAAGRYPPDILTNVQQRSSGSREASTKTPSGGGGGSKRDKQ